LFFPSKRKEIIRKLVALDHERDITSARNSSSMPHYFGLIQGTVGCAPFLKAKLPCHLATCAATMRLSYDRFYFKGEWYKLGAFDGVPCRYCGDEASFAHIFYDCPGLAQARLTCLGPHQRNSDVLRTLSLAPANPIPLQKLYYYMCKITKALSRSAAVDKPTYFTT